MANFMERVNVTLTLTTSAQTAVETNIDGWTVGWLRTVKFVVGATDNPTCSGTFHIYDSDGTEIYTSGEYLQGTTTLVTGLSVGLLGGELVKMTTSAEPSGAAAAESISVANTVRLVVTQNY